LFLIGGNNIDIQNLEDKASSLKENTKEENKMKEEQELGQEYLSLANLPKFGCSIETPKLGAFVDYLARNGFERLDILKMEGVYYVNAYRPNQPEPTKVDTHVPNPSALEGMSDASIEDFIG